MGVKVKSKCNKRRLSNRSFKGWGKVWNFISTPLPQFRTLEYFFVYSGRKMASTIPNAYSYAKRILYLPLAKKNYANRGTLRGKNTVQALSVLTKASVWYEIRVLWAKITHIQSHVMTLAFILQTDRNQIFQMRYCASL